MNVRGGWRRGVAGIGLTLAVAVGAAAGAGCQDGPTNTAPGTVAPGSTADSGSEELGEAGADTTAVDATTGADAIDAMAGVGLSVRITSPADGVEVAGQALIRLAVEGGAGERTVEVRVNPTTLAVLGGAPWEVLWLVPAAVRGDIPIRVIATDAAGHQAEDTRVVRVTGSCSPDGNCPPDVAILRPAPNEVICGTVLIEATAEDDQDIPGVHFMLGGIPVGDGFGQPLARLWDTREASDGPHLLHVEARDKHGLATSVARWVVVQNHGGVCESPLEVSVSSSWGRSVLGAEPFIRVAAWGGSEVASVALSVDGGPASEESAPSYAFKWDTHTVTDGPHTLTAVATDVAGAVATEKLEVVVDNTPPKLTVLSPLPGAWVGDTIVVKATVEDETATKLIIQLQGFGPEDGVGDVSGPAPHVAFDASAQKSGWRSLSVVALDAAFNSSNAVSFLVQIDHPPSLDLQVPLAGKVYSGVVKLSAKAHDDFGVAQWIWRLDGVQIAADHSGGAAYATSTPSLDTSLIALGTHTVSVEVSDTVGVVAVREAAMVVETAPAPSTLTLSLCQLALCKPVGPGAEIAGKEWRLQGVSVGGASVPNDVTFKVGESVPYVDSSAPFFQLFDATLLPDGPITLSAVGTWTSGKTVTASLDVVVNNCDQDHDGSLSWACGGDDCDDTQPDFLVGKPDPFGDGVDSNCDGADGVDQDGDGVASIASGGGDCNDLNAAIFPGAPDLVGDKVDQSCDGADGSDGDGDGFSSVAGGGTDCDDAAPETYPGAPDTLGDGVDQSCDGADGLDGDGDGHATEASGGDDCDDSAPDIYLDAVDDHGDGADQNCDGADGVDVDGDGYGGGCGGDGLAVGVVAQSGAASLPIGAAQPSVVTVDVSAVPADAQVVYVQGSYRLSHSYWADLRVLVCAPSGDCAVVREYEGGAHGGLLDEHFTVSAALDGEVAGGAWTLRVLDNAWADPGLWDTWSLTIGYSYSAPFAPTCDCQDNDPSVHPGASDALGDGVDTDCDGVDGADHDGDGYVSVETGGDDCDDSDAARHPALPDVVAGTGTEMTQASATVDDAGKPGRHMSVAVDAAGAVHLAYYEAQLENLRYAHGASVDVLPVTVDAAGDVGRYAALAIDPLGAARIAYQDATIGAVKLARAPAPGSAKELVYVDPGGLAGVGIDLAIDALGASHVVFGDPTGARIAWATEAGGGWTVETVSPDGATAQLAVAVGPVGPLVLWGDPLGGQLWLARRAAGGWTASALSMITASDGPARALDLAAGPDGEIHVVLRREEDGRMVYGRLSGGQWRWKTLASAASAPGSPLSLARDPAGRVAVGYVGGAGDRLLVATNAVMQGVDNFWTVKVAGVDGTVHDPAIAFRPSGALLLGYRRGGSAGSSQARLVNLSPVLAPGPAIDSNCDGVDGVDSDGDGFASYASGGDDCDDTDPDRHPAVPGGGCVAPNEDVDGDGWTAATLGGGDCDDADPTVNPSAADAPGDGVDTNCDGADGELCGAGGPCQGQ